ncbi:hypothetical protein MJ1HA_1533 [Metallosphaera sedula]|nr:hypothetical protein MJ1HA_1533 [Metallosphaera sedula]
MNSRVIYAVSLIFELLSVDDLKPYNIDLISLDAQSDPVTCRFSSGLMELDFLSYQMD